MGVLVDRVSRARADPDKLRGRRVEHDEPVLCLLRGEIRVEPHAEIERQVPADLVRVAREESVRLHADIGRPVAQRDGEVAAKARLKAREAWEGEGAGVGRKAIAPETAPLAAELERMVAARQRRRIGDDVGRVFASLRKPLRATEVQADAVDGDLRQADGPRDTGLDAEAGLVELGVRIEGDVDPVESKPRLVHEALAEDVRFVQRHDLPVRVARIAEAGNRVALQRRLAPQILLERVVAVKRVARANGLADVAGPLVDVHGRDLGADEARGAVDGRVRVGNELQQRARDRIGDGRTLGVAQDAAVDVDPLALPESFVGHEEERAVLHDRSAERGAELVALERRLARRRDVERVARVETLVAVELERLARESCCCPSASRC